jgi:tRNA A64-2'-O-ribosylphosphate transferase
MSKALTQSDLIFPIQSLNLSTTLHSLKRSALSIHNRLTSITSDSHFVQSVADAYDLPLVANERCGSWYIPPEKKTESVYFKSTDGHMNEWSFNLRRLNYQLLDVVKNFGGCVIADSTRRGKSMPDAMSKTVPIWCCILNRVVFKENSMLHELYTPPQAVSPSEHAQIEERLDHLVSQFQEICRPNIPQLRQKLQKPLRPLWITQGSTLPDTPPKFSDFHPIVLCTASRRVHGGEVSEGGYIQGAADDHEAWAQGLTPELFWANKDLLLTTNEEELPGLISSLIKSKDGSDAVPLLVKPTPNLYISSSQSLDISPFDTIISCTPEPLTTMNEAYVKTKRYLHLPLSTGKLGSRDLRVQLQRVPAFLEAVPEELGNVVVCDPTGKDTSIGVALAILCLHADENGQISKIPTGRKIEKAFIKQRLTWITTTAPTLNPSRETLKAVNFFLMPDPFSTSTRLLEADIQGPPVSRLTLQKPNTSPESNREPSLKSSVPAAPDSLPPESIQTTKIHLHQPLPKPEIHIPVTDIPIEDIPSPLLERAYAMARESQNYTTSSTGSQSLIPRILFASLQNNNASWQFKRTLDSKLPTHPSGTVTGIATFTITRPGDTTLLYAEEGEFVTDTGLSFTARRKYVYRLEDANTEPYISVHFFDDEKPGSQANGGENGDGVGGLFVEMGDLIQGSQDGDWEAKSKETHLCGQDLYAASWSFSRAMASEMKSNGEKWWEVRYDVKGPKKDYVSETRYTIA